MENKVKPLLFLLLVAVGGYGAVDTTQSLCLQVENASHSSNLGTFSPYGVNEFDLKYYDGEYYLFYCSYAGSPSKTYLRVAPTVEALVDSPEIDLTTKGVLYSPVVPSVEVKNDTFYMVVAALDSSSKTMLFRSVSPKTSWTRATSFSIPAGGGDDCIRRNPVDSKWYIARERNTDFANGPPLWIYRSDSAAGTYTKISTVFDSTATMPWFYGQYDAQIAFAYGRAYAVFTALNNVDTNWYDYIAMVELDTSTYRAIGKPVLVQAPDQDWHVSSTGKRRVFDGVILDDGVNGIRCYYAVQSWIAPAGWGYVQFNMPERVTQIPNNSYMTFPITIPAGATGTISNFMYERDISSIFKTPMFNTTFKADSSTMFIYDPVEQRICSTYVNTDTANFNRHYDVKWVGNATTAEKQYYLCVSRGITRTNHIPADILTEVLFDSLPVDNVNGAVCSGSITSAFKTGIINGGTYFSGSNYWTIWWLNYNKFNARTQFTIEMILSLHNKSQYDAITTVYKDNNNRIVIGMNNDTLDFYVISGGTSPRRRWKIGATSPNGRHAHIVITYNSGNLQMYLNGDSLAYVDDGTIPSTLPTFVNPYLQLSVNTSSGLNGEMSLWRLYSDVKTKTWSSSRYKTTMDKYFYIDAPTYTPPVIDSTGIASFTIYHTGDVDSVWIDSVKATLSDAATDSVIVTPVTPLMVRRDPYTLQLFSGGVGYPYVYKMVKGNILQPSGSFANKSYINSPFK